MPKRPLANAFIPARHDFFSSYLAAKPTRPGCGERCWPSPSRICAGPARPTSSVRDRATAPPTATARLINESRTVGQFGAKAFMRMAIVAPSSQGQNRPAGNFSIPAPVLRARGDHSDGLDSEGPHVHLRQRGWLFGLAAAMEDIIPLEAGRLDRRLSSVPLLGGLDESSLVALEAELEWLSVPGGATLFYEDQIPDALYVVISGCLGVTVRGTDGGEVRVARCQAGDTVGEMGLLGGGRRSATVTALRDTVLLRLEKSSFERLVGRHPLSMLSIVSQLVHRLRTTTRLGRDKTANRTVALLPVGQDVDHRVIARALAEQLASGGERIELLDSESSVHTAEWFNEVEARSDKVLFCAEPANSAWTRLCLRQADRVVFMVSAKSPFSVPVWPVGQAEDWRQP
jgi:CRP-like cAMP-binding protein